MKACHLQVLPPSLLSILWPHCFSSSPSSHSLPFCQAAKAIFRNRNKLADLEAGRIDLHGLHVSEARDCLAELIPLYERVGIPRLRVVTGTGHHTKGPQEGRARLLPHVRAYCEEERGLRCQEIKDDGGFSGALQVDLRR
jgi:hypothetical protein